MLAHQDRLLDLRLLNLALLAHGEDALPVLRRHHLIILHPFHLLVHSLVVALLQFHDFVGSLARLLDLLPSLELLLLEEGDAVREQLRVALNTTFMESHKSNSISRQAFPCRYRKQKK